MHEILAEGQRALWHVEGKCSDKLLLLVDFLPIKKESTHIMSKNYWGALCGLEYFKYFRYYVYRKRVNLLTDHRALQPMLRRNRAHKQYSARLTCWFYRLSHFDVNVLLFKPPPDNVRQRVRSRKQNGLSRRNGSRRRSRYQSIIWPTTEQSEALRNSSNELRHHKKPTNHSTASAHTSGI